MYTIIHNEPTYTARHPEGLCCPICGCNEIWYWIDIENWENMSNEQKRYFEVCPACDYGSKDFPYEEFM